jgi:hypothetical protein
MYLIDADWAISFLNGGHDAVVLLASLADEALPFLHHVRRGV